MLRRQQASAIITAREKIEGAVTMVKLALDRLEKEEVVKLDNDRKAAMIGNLLVVPVCRRCSTARCEHLGQLKTATQNLRAGS